MQTFARYEKRHSFNFFIQWAENFICDEVAGEELWEEVVAAARMLANSTEAEVLSHDLTHFFYLVDLAAI